MPDFDALVGPGPCCCTRFLHEVVFWRMDAATNDGQIDVHEFVQFCTQYKKDMDKKRENKKDRASMQIDLAVQPDPNMPDPNYNPNQQFALGVPSGNDNMALGVPSSSQYDVSGGSVR